MEVLLTFPRTRVCTLTRLRYRSVRYGAYGVIERFVYICISMVASLAGFILQKYNRVDLLLSEASTIESIYYIALTS